MKRVTRSLGSVAVLAIMILAVSGPAEATPKVSDLKFSTVPAVPGFPVTFDGKTVKTDSAGVAHFRTSNVHSLTDRTTLKDSYMKVAGQDAHVVAARLFVNGRPRIAMDIFWPIQFSYVDVNGGHVDVNKISAVKLKSSTGEIRRVHAQKPVWLHGSRVVPLAGGLENKKIYWTVQEVEYASTNVVNSSQQRFLPADIQKVPLKLLFYRAEIKARDGILGYGVGRSVLLTYPDKSVEKHNLGADHSVALKSLPRGNYSVVVDGPGPQMTRPVAISRDQVLDLKFYSWLDIAVVVAFGALFGFGSLWVGLRRRKAHRRSLLSLALATLGNQSALVQSEQRQPSPPPVPAHVRPESSWLGAARKRLKVVLRSATMPEKSRRTTAGDAESRAASPALSSITMSSQGLESSRPWSWWPDADSSVDRSTSAQKSDSVTVTADTAATQPTVPRLVNFLRYMSFVSSVLGIVQWPAAGRSRSQANAPRETDATESA